LKTVEDMPPAGTIIVVLLVLVFIVAFVIPLARNTKPAAHEGFDMDPLLQLNKFSRKDMIDRSQKVYNKFSDSQDVRRPTFISSDDPDDIRIANRKIRDAMYTADLEPNGLLKKGAVKKTKLSESDPTVITTQSYSPVYKTLMATHPTKVTAQLPPPNGIITMAKKCETLKSRDSCPNLDDPDYKYCGVCIDGGTDHTERYPGKHIGGLLILPSDRQEAEDAAKEAGTPAVYNPTVGACPPGKFFLKSDICTREANRQNCLEIGQTGGFVSGKTVEGKTATVANCAQVPTMSEDLYVYNPAGRKFNINLRVLTPIGTGKSMVFVYNKSGVLIAGDRNVMPGLDKVITVRDVNELQELTVIVAQEVPLRKSGSPEVFLFNENGESRNQSRESSAALCNRIGTQLATKEQLTSSWRNGAQSCKRGFTNEGIFNPTKGTYYQQRWRRTWWGGSEYYWEYPCGYGDNLNYDSGSYANSWCYGVKPPVSTNMIQGLTSYIGNFFDSFGNNTTPAQGEDIYSQFSKNPDYQGPLLFRAVLLQWEMEGDSIKRTVPFETTIVKVDKYPIKSTTGRTILKRFGTFSGSSAINMPKPGVSQILRSTQWLWGRNALSQSMEFSVQVPGVLLDPVYKEDGSAAARGPLLNKQETLKLLNTSPCLKEGQVAGNYSMPCLINLFSGVGGDLQKGRLARENGGLIQLNKLGDSDQIADYLYNLYSLARTGRDANGVAPTGTSSQRSAVINNASQSLYGFDVATPCEEIVETESGDIQLRPKSTPLTSECLNYLWLNTNSDKDRGSETRAGSSVLNTYTTIGDRFSGLMNTESTQAQRDRYPFQACQLTGSLAPLTNGNANYTNMAKANAKGSVQAVQDFYNSVHKTANYSTKPDSQNEALQQCYGITRNPTNASASACSVQARFVRVLSNSLTNTADGSVIQIPQIQVFDTDGNELARGRPVYAAAQCCNTVPEYAVDGKAYPHSHTEGEFHSPGSDLDNEYWMVDLGRMFNVQEIRFYPRTDCCTNRHLGAPIQLLNDRKQVVAEKLLGSTNWPTKWGQMESLTFINTDKKPLVALSDIESGLRMSLRSAIHFNRILRHTNFQYVLSDPDMAGEQYSTTLRNDGTLNVVAAKNGRSDHVSFESVNFPNYFLGHSIGQTRVILAPAGAYSTPPEYMNITSFKPVKALNGNPSMVSWLSGSLNRSKGKSEDYYIAVDKDDATSIIMDKTNGSLRDVERFCWTILPALA